MKVVLWIVIALLFAACAPKANIRQDVLKRYLAPKKSYKTDASWNRYKKNVLTSKRVQRAKFFIKRYHNVLKRAEKEYNVEKEYIVAFLAIETNFCSYTGSFCVYDVLYTLSSNKNRMQNFFKKELKELKLLAKEENKDIRSYKGSFAGAMGCVQELPSIHRRYGVDFDFDGKKDLYNIVDSIGTIAKFLHKNGWQKGAKVAVKARYKAKRYKGLETGYNKLYSLKRLKENGIIPYKKIDENIVSLLQLRDLDHDELWLGCKNMRVLTKYNHSTNYGMAIYKFAKKLKGKR